MLSGAWSLAVLPDTQFYTEDEERLAIWQCMMDWLITHREERNIRMVLHEGDLVNHNRPEHWERAQRAMQRLRGHLPCMLTAGNHDFGAESVGSDRSTLLNEYIFPRDLAPLAGRFRDAGVENSYSLFEANEEDFLVLSLEFGPRDEVLSWANGVLLAHPHHRSMILTHECLLQESSVDRDDLFCLRSTPEDMNAPYHYGLAAAAGGVNCGEEVWDKLVRHHPQVEFIFNGHYRAVERVDGELQRVDDIATGYRCDELPGGGLVHQMLFNAQWAPMGGEGWLRMLEFHPDGKSVAVKTVSPWYVKQGKKAWRQGAEHAFTLKRRNWEAACR